MDLKDFIKETISSIADATIDLQKEYADKGVIINPPASYETADVYDENAAYTKRRVENISFDVAISATSSTKGGAKAGLKVLSVEVGGDGEHAREHENVSRVQFSIPLTLPPSADESSNKKIAQEQDRRFREAQEERRRKYRPV